MGTFKHFVETVEGPALRIFAAPNRPTLVYDPARHQLPDGDDEHVLNTHGQ
jgi:hypothetical protein